MKKFSIITFIIICASALFDISNIHAQEQFVVDGIKYQTLTDSTVQVIANGYTQDTIEIPSKVTNYELEFTVTKIGDKAFSYHTGLTNIVLPNTITEIGKEAFYYCRNLSDITIPNSVTTIGTYAFRESRLTSITIPNSVTELGFGAFYKCSILASVTLSNNLKVLNSDTFGGTSLKSVTIPESVESIYRAFDDCYDLQKVNLPNNLKYLSGFYNCVNLTKIDIPNSVTTIGNDAFYGSGLETIDLPNSVAEIQGYAFTNCTGLTTINIPNSVTTIGNEAFYDCIGLTQLVIPSSVQTIGENCFENVPCRVAFMSSTPCVWNRDGWDETITISVPCGSISNYKNDTKWNKYANIRERTCNSVDTEANICANGSYNFNGREITTTGTYSDTINISPYADSIYTLTLTVNDNYMINYNETICQGETYTLNGFNQNTAGVYTRTVAGNGGCDTVITLNLFIGNYDTIINASICQGETYSLYGFNESTAGTYTQELKSINGCDSIITLNLTVGNRYDTVINATICQGETYDKNGFNVSASGEYTQSLKSISNCDSTVRLSLTVLPAYDTVISASICQGETYSLYGFNESTAGTYKQELKSINGCDSTVTLILTVYHKYDTVINAFICQGETYSLYGFNENNAGTYIQELKSINGCDSIITLNLTVGNRYDTVINATICQGETYDKNSFNVSASGEYTQSLKSISNCDSTVRLSLTVLPAYDTVISASICQGETYSLYGFNESTAGTYKHSLQRANGCDSTVKLTLTVYPKYDTVINASICQGETYSLYGFNENTAGNYTQELKSINGCDSTVILYLTVNDKAQTNTEVTICDNGSYSFNGKELTQAGEYYDTLQTIAGCDSIVHLTLYIDTTSIITKDTVINAGDEINGKRYDTDGTYIDSLKTQNGCDSIIIWTLKVGLNEIDYSAICSVYPNPAEDNITVDFGDLALDGKQELTIINNAGQVVYKSNINSRKFNIDIKDFDSGAYYIIINGTRTQKLIKK